MSEPIPSEATTYALRRFAAEAIKQAAERGDMDHPTVTWVVGWMLRKADEGDAARDAARVVGEA